MCRLLGIVCNKPADLSFSLKDGDRSLSEQSRRNPDGWGVASYQGDWSVAKEPVAAESSDLYHEIAKGGRGEIFVCHVRRASRGQNMMANTHPFLRDGWVFAHNGTIRDDLAVVGITPDTRFAPEGDTDSEAFLCLFLSILEETSPEYPQAKPACAMAALRAAIINLKRCDGLNLVLSDGWQLYFHRDGRPLWWLRRTAQNLLLGESDSLAVMLRDKALLGEEAVLVASEQLTDEDWEEVPPHRIFAVDRDLGLVEEELQ